MASVAFERLSKTYPNGHCALSHFSLEVADGELVVLVGPSGCGKSTLLRLLAGLEQPTEGTSRIAGRVVNDLSPQARNIAMVFQDYALYPTMTVRGNLEFPLRMRKLNRQEVERRIAWAAELLALTDVLHRLPKELSGGQRQRVAMGRALVRDPTVFLLDEPLSNLDAQLRVQVRGEIAELQRRTGTTMLYVTHDQVEAMTMGQRIAVLKEGQLQQVGTPKELYEHPANIFVAAFIGTPAMNLVPGRLLLQAVEAAGMNVAALVRHLPQSPRMADDLMRSVSTFTAGIRPEALSATEADQPGLPAIVAQVEYLGHETLVHFHFGELNREATKTTCVARLNSLRAYAFGQSIRIQVENSRIAWFDAQGLAI